MFCFDHRMYLSNLHLSKINVFQSKNITNIFRYPLILKSIQMSHSGNINLILPILINLYHIIQGVTLPIITLLGLVGNVLSILVLHSPGIDMKV